MNGVVRGSLLEKALALPVRRRRVVTDEEIEVSLAWLRGELSNSQVCRVFYPGIKTQTTNNSLMLVANCLREASRRGRLVEKSMLQLAEEHGL